MSQTIDLSVALASHVGVPAMARLRAFARWVKSATGGTVYVAGSAMRTKSFRDVDVYLAYPDADYAARYQPHGELWWFHCSAFGLLASSQTGMDVDFHVVNLTHIKTMSPRLELS